MKYSFTIYTLILAVGFFLLPNLNYACGTNAKKPCCEKVNSSKKSKKECCNGDDKKGQNNNCNGKCGHANCTTSSTISSIISFNEILFKNICFGYSTQKPKFYNSKTFISSGFTSVWSPPNIK